MVKVDDATAKCVVASTDPIIGTVPTDVVPEKYVTVPVGGIAVNTR
jgi:hypothetical protein